MKDPLIKLENISFSYNSYSVLENINFELNLGEKIGLIGPNGSGKTTLLFIIMGFLKPLSGKIFILGKERKKEKDFLEVRQKLGLLFQDSDSQLFCPTVKEDIAFGPLNLGKNRKEVKEIVEKIASLFNIKHLLERPIYKLSGGEKKVVALATVFAMDPIAYLLDEPSSGLDEEIKKKLIEFLKVYVKTCLIVSHDHEFLKATVEKIYILKNKNIYLY
ncbi:MAG: energy-coupling factor ABC transporter ATP-binding protein [Thermodesulfobacterium geofontis]|uniref:Energy-coupling factor ABC transporter ATP-binding protein n=1 Tax=Thermodesulfobacterium geofontis TaxID=1295609 RepID=A0A2N7PP61_9BACT|nr:MAG: energy-coupling factor ABC transporter ATP-binding protein [Thermodesulfobacterium geofontis]